MLKNSSLFNEKITLRTHFVLPKDGGSRAWSTADSIAGSASKTGVSPTAGRATKNGTSGPPVAPLTTVEADRPQRQRRHAGSCRQRPPFIAADDRVAPAAAGTAAAAAAPPSAATTAAAAANAPAELARR